MAKQRTKKKRGRPKDESGPRVTASFRLPEELLERLKSQAKAEERSQTTLLKRALEAYLAAQEGGAGEADNDD